MGGYGTEVLVYFILDFSHSFSLCALGGLYMIFNGNKDDPHCLHLGFLFFYEYDLIFTDFYIFFSFTGTV